VCACPFAERFSNGPCLEIFCNPADEKNIFPMSFILSILIISLAGLGIAIILRKGKEVNNDNQDPEQKSSGQSSSIVSSISEVFSKRKEDFVNARKAVTKSRFGIVPLLKLPPVPKNFVGRKSILADIFSRVGKGSIYIGLYGSSGVGKTGFGVVLVKSLRSKFNEEPIYIDMRGFSAHPLSSEEVMVRVINLLRSSEKFPEPESKRAHLYTTLLQRRKLVLFLDNVPNSQALKPLLPPKNCALVVTSLKPLALPHLISKKLNPLDTGDAQKLLLKTSPRTGFWGNEISKLCGDFPLALVLAGQYVATYQNQDCSKFLESLREGLKQNQSRPGEAVQKSLDVVLNICYRSLSEKNAGVLRKLVLFPESFDSKAAIFLCEDSENEHLISLLSLGLLSHNDETNRFYFHPQVRRFLMVRLKDGEQALAEKRFAAYYLTVMIAAGEFYGQGGKDRDRGLNLFDVEWENIKKGWSWAEDNSEQDQEADNLCLSYAEAAIRLLGHRKSPAEGLKWYKAALDSAKRLNESESEAKYHLLLGTNYTQLDQAEDALGHLEEALKLSKQSEDRRIERKALGQLGLAHLSLGKSHRAIEFLEKELELLRKSDETKGEESKLEALGRIYFEVGDTDQSIAYYKQELHLAREHQDTRRQGRVLGDLGGIYVSLKDHENAIENFDKGLALVKKIGDKKGEITLLGKLGEAYTETEEFKKALPYFQQGLALAQVLKDRSKVCLMTEQMGHSYFKSGNHREAIAYYQKVLVLFQKSGDKAKEGETLWNLAQALRQSEKISEAIILAKEALGLYQKIKRLNGDTQKTIEKHLQEWQAMTGQETTQDAVEKPAPQPEEEIPG
jgi:tetratricopeptide (TPR) repeat protein